MNPIIEIGTRQNPITHGGVNRGWKFCKCSKCGTVDQCTPTRDFYTTDDDAGPLRCEPCLMRDFRSQQNIG